jgi:hypothetical protein
MAEMRECENENGFVMVESPTCRVVLEFTANLDTTVTLIPRSGGRVSPEW